LRLQRARDFVHIAESIFSIKTAPAAHPIEDVPAA
jgi:hypothetical protein